MLKQFLFKKKGFVDKHFLFGRVLKNVFFNILFADEALSGFHLNQSLLNFSFFQKIVRNFFFVQPIMFQTNN